MLVESSKPEPVLRKIIRALPPLAQAKIKSRARAALAHRAESDTHAKHRWQLSERKSELQVQIGSLERNKASNHPFGPDDEAALVELRDELAEVKKEIRKSSASPTNNNLTREERRKRRILTEFAIDIDEWIASRTLSDRFIEHRVDLPKGDLSAALASCRVAQDEVLSGFIRLEDAPLDLETALKKMRLQVRELAERGAPKVGGIIRLIGERQGEIRWPIDNTFSFDLSASASLEHGVAFSVWLNREAVEKRLESEIRAKLEFENGLTFEQRETANKELRAKLLDLHRLESRICAELSDKKIAHETRRLHPLAFLEIKRGKSVALEDRSLIIPGVFEEPVANSTLI